jgi:Protein of unknown function (DUF1573)
MKKLLFSCFVSLVCGTTGVMAQATIDFKETEYDFGLVKEGEQAQHVFKFENNGNDTLKLFDVRASCGCTTPNWPKTGIVDGESSEILVSYNSSGRPGSFYKTISIEHNGKEASSQVVIKGYVVNANSLPDSTSKAKSPSLILDKTELNFGKVAVNKQTSLEIKLKNTSKESVSITAHGAGCSCVSIEGAQEIAAGETKTISIKYTPRKTGENVERLVLVTSDKAQSIYQIVAKGMVVESLTAPKTLMEQDNQAGFGF